MMESIGIENQELVIAQFGQWPAFHDAEIVSMLFERAEPGYWPVVSLMIYAVGGFDKTTATPAKHCLIGLRFVGVRDHELTGFNHQNVIFSLDFTKDNNLIICNIEPCYGVSGHIAAERVIVDSVVLVDENPQQSSHD